MKIKWIVNKLIQFKIFRVMLESQNTFGLSKGVWYLIDDFPKNTKLEKVSGKYNNLVYCYCGNELTHSDSFIGTRELLTNSQVVYDFKCSNCEEIIHMNPGIIPGLIECDWRGNPLG